MVYKFEDYLIIDKAEATEEMIKSAKNELRTMAEHGYKGDYVKDSIVFKVQEKEDEVYVCAEWEESVICKKWRKKNDQGAKDQEGR